VGSIRGLYERFRHLIHEGFKFLVIGAIGTVITFGVANGLQSIGRYKAVTIATILATVFTYLGNRYWTFRRRQGQGTTRESIIFFVLNGIGLLIYWGCIGLTDLAGLGTSKLWYNAALVVGTGLGTLFRFWSYRKWVWLAPPATPVLSPAESDEDRAQDLAAMVGAAPLSHHTVSHHTVNHHAAGNHSVNHHAGSASTGARPRTPGAHRRTR
jgi:putative flippase GtrA